MLDLWNYLRVRNILCLVTLSMNNDSIIVWLKCVSKSLGRGGRTNVAKTLGISKSHLSKIITRGSGFDDKTLRVFSWILSSKDEQYAQYPVLKEQKINGFVFRTRELPTKEKVLTWRVFRK